jgi:enoyl-CoA hydratase/carnithine racemase
MTRPAYFDKYPTIAFERDEHGVLILRLHSDGGPVRYSPQHHTDWSTAFLDVGADRDNKVVILTGTGDAFMDAFAWDRPLVTPAMWDDIYFEGKHFIRRLLDIEVPVIGAVNGPATVHAELAVLSDITIASDTAVFGDKPHIPGGSVPGDGVHIVWQEILGSNRGRYFLLTGQTLSAKEALDLGVVNEVVPADRLMDRALELAHQLAELNPLVLRYSRVALTQRLKRLIDENLGYGLALEALAGLENVRLRQQAATEAGGAS